MIVISRYELFDLERIIKEVDPKGVYNDYPNGKCCWSFQKRLSKRRLPECVQF